MTSTSANGLFGRVGEFLPERETFSAYVERMEMFFTANNIVESTGEGSAQANQVLANRKRAIFLTEVGPEVYSTLSNLLAPAKPKDTPFADIVEILEKHYNPKPLEIAQSFHFSTRKQESRESISDYVLALRRLAVHCDLWRVFGSCFTRPICMWTEQSQDPQQTLEHRKTHVRKSLQGG